MYDDKNKSTEITKTYNRNIRDLVEWFFIAPALTLISGLAIAAGSVHIYWTEGVFEPPLQFEIPFLQKDSVLTIYFNSGIQIAFIPFAAYGMIAIELGQSILNNTIKLFVAVTSTNIEEFNTQLMNKKKMDLELKTQLRNILVQIQDYDR